MRSTLFGRCHTFLLLSGVLFVVTACAKTMESAPASTTTPPPIATRPPTPTPEPTPTPLPTITLDRELPEGDAEQGYLTAIRFRCHGCHVNDKDPSYAPRFVSSAELPPVLERGEDRIAEAGYAGRATTNREYIIESILLPEAYFVQGEWEEAMPTHLLHTLSDEELADILAWMATFE